MTDFDPAYRGARSYKCVLHLHAPADGRLWPGEKLPSWKEEQKAAKGAKHRLRQPLVPIGGNAIPYLPASAVSL